MIVNGPLGNFTELTVSFAVPVLVKLAESVSVEPTATLAKFRVAGLPVKPGFVALPTSDAPSTTGLPESVAEKFSVPTAEPGPVGENVTGTFNDAPALSVTGNVGAVATANGAEVLTAVTVTVRSAVAVTVAE